ncbi:PP2C family protein-serine/threonine phosphatase [Ornithinicoccus halotolerans]|uniref:PP2C family protein-serine/threonine phosphatase n=1 Tax=Ornithinicoccus halotolerans TaxID=1748220 RepID=UPI0012974785|nr:protein phosphatase 2C domain-containing protein [Ornithinicoccus halotolerans]
MTLALRYAARSHIGLGTKSRNEDSAYAGPELLVMCDGMGGHAAGDVASSLVVGELVHLDGESHGGDDLLAVLEESMLGANASLGEVAEQTQALEGMGTTCIAMLRSGSKLAVANVGDSRAYLRRGNRVTQITKDHSFVQKLLDEGRIDEEEALHHPQRSLVTRVLTGRDEDRPDLSMRELREGDRLLLCTDGLTDYVAVDTVADLLRTGSSAVEVANRLLEMALRASTRDNVTVIVADVVAPGAGSTDPQVVGAASERRGGGDLSAAATPAEKAAALARAVHGPEGEAPELAEESDRHPVLRWVRRAMVGLVVLLVVAAGLWATYGWSQQQYYVGEADGQVTIFRGVSQDLGPIALSEQEEQTGLPVADLPSYYQDQVARTISTDSREGADALVSELRALAAQDCPPGTALPSPEATAGPETTAGPTAAPQQEETVDAAGRECDR